MSEPHRIAVIAGDGIGQEVVPEGVRVLEAVGRRFGIDLAFTSFDWGPGRGSPTRSARSGPGR